MAEPELLSRIEDLEARLSSLQRRGRHLPITIAVLGVMLTVAALFLIGQNLTGDSQALRGSSLVLEGANGRGAILMGVEDDGDVAISLRGADDTKRILLATSGDGSSLFSLFDRSQEARVSLGVVNDVPVAILSDERGRTRLLLNLREDGTPLIRLLNSDQTDLLRLPADE